MATNDHHANSPRASPTATTTSQPAPILVNGAASKHEQVMDNTRPTSSRGHDAAVVSSANDIPAAPTSAPPPVPITIAPPVRPPTADGAPSPKNPNSDPASSTISPNMAQKQAGESDHDGPDKRDSGLGPSMLTTTTKSSTSTGHGEDGGSALPSTIDTTPTTSDTVGGGRNGSIEAGTESGGASTQEQTPFKAPSKTTSFATPLVTMLERPATSKSHERPSSRWKFSLGKKGGQKLTTAQSFEEPHRLRKRQPGFDTGTPPRTSSSTSAVPSDRPFTPILMELPGENLLELESLSFSKRGSVLLGGKKAVVSTKRQLGVPRKPSISMLTTTNPRMLPDEVVKESVKVRSMYETGVGMNWKDGEAIEDEKATMPTGLNIANGSSSGAVEPQTLSSYMDSPRKQHELAGGIEDWEDVEGKDVDRYGFITRKDVFSDEEAEFKPPHRVSTALQLASESPRKRRTFGRSVSNARSSRSTVRQQGGKKVLARSVKTQKTQNSAHSSIRGPNKPFRQVANRLPGNQDRRWMDEAGDMLTLPPGLADIAEEQEGGKGAEEQKKKEWERAEKWRRMAKVRKPSKDGEGMEFEFDTTDPKVIERTWKGIPDRWRATAWHSFLSASARKRPDSPTDAGLIDSFHQALQASSADDVQIDIDVPRTINSHIMFRSRYRGGQRLLFRVLHAFSLYAADTGYVQGMASLAATLLCYYDEERAFIMLVRMWELRGLNKLYAAGFAGLMAALDEFQKQWLHGREVAKQLDGLCIEPTAYGTRWYLTLFNYSIPFVAQLRVWDVFMLLGDADPDATVSPERPFAGTLDVLHATAAALIDGTREILLDSDFENAMKVLTSWIPIKDEELLMRVAKAEWRLHRNRKKS